MQVETTDQYHLLAVDDEEINILILKEFFEDTHYRVTYARSSAEAWELIQNEQYQFDTLLLDWIMPDGDGLELLKKVKQEERYRRTPAIMVTGRTSPAAMAEGLSAGAFYYLTKPIEEDILLAVVKAAVDEMASVRTLHDNKHQLARALQLMKEGSFRFRTLPDIEHLIECLSNLFSENINTPIGLRELMINAIEHGNLGISYDEKTALMKSNHWEQEVQRRLSLAENKHKYAQLKLVRQGNEIVICITDQGPGFDWEKYLELQPERLCDPHGRGIAIAKMMSFDELTYLAPGNSVEVKIKL